jgi:hypothetical protein
VFAAAPQARAGDRLAHLARLGLDQRREREHRRKGDAGQHGDDDEETEQGRHGRLFWAFALHHAMPGKASVRPCDR